MTGDDEIWARAVAGDPGAFGEVFDRHQARVYGHALRLCRHRHDAEDVTAVVFLEAWRRRRAVRVVDGSVLAWLLVTTGHVTQNLARSSRRHRIALASLPPHTAVEDPAEGVAARLDTVDRDRRLRRALDGLSKADRDVLGLCVLEELPMATAAQALGVPVGTVKSRLSRAKARLAREMSASAPITDRPVTRNGETHAQRTE